MESSLLQQALAAAPERNAPPPVRPSDEYFVFRIGTLTAAVRSELVREVTRLGPLTALPRAPAFLLGVAAHRGEVVPVIDLMRFLSFGELVPASRSRLFISETEKHVVGFLAEQVIGLRRIFVADKTPAPGGSVLTPDFLEGVVHSREHGSISLLQLTRIIHAARTRAMSR